MNYPFLFKVEIYDDNKTQHQAGLIHAENYGEAAQQIEHYYGETLVAIEYLFGMEEGPVIVTGEAFDAILKGEWDCETIL